jgi:hypothetical protein
MIARKGRGVLRKTARFVYSGARRYLFGDAERSTCIHNMGMSRPVVLPRDSGSQEPKLHAVRHAKSDALMFGSSLADVFSTPAYDCRAFGPDQKPEFAVTRLRSGPRDMEKAPAYPPDQAVLICVSLTPSAIGQWKALYSGKSVGVTRAIPFATTFHRFELQDGNVGARAVRLSALLPFLGTA